MRTFDPEIPPFPTLCEDPPEIKVGTKIWRVLWAKPTATNQKAKYLAQMWAHSDDAGVEQRSDGRFVNFYHDDSTLANPYGFVDVSRRKNRESLVVRIATTGVGQYVPNGSYDAFRLRAVGVHHFAVSGNKSGLVCFLTERLPPFWTHLEVVQLITKPCAWTQKDLRKVQSSVMQSEKKRMGQKAYDDMMSAPDDAVRVEYDRDGYLWDMSYNRKRDAFYDRCETLARQILERRPAPRKVTSVVAQPKTDGMAQLAKMYGPVEEVTEVWLKRAAREGASDSVKRWAERWEAQEKKRQQEAERQKRLRVAEIRQQARKLGRF